MIQEHFVRLEVGAVERELPAGRGAARREQQHWHLPRLVPALWGRCGVHRGDGEKARHEGAEAVAAAIRRRQQMLQLRAHLHRLRTVLCAVVGDSIRELV